MADKRYHYALGRRKTATATVRLFEGKGETIINGKALAEIYPSELEQNRLFRPLTVAGLDKDKFYITVQVKGSGVSGQMQAIQHGLSRAIVIMDPELKRPLKKAGLMKRDPRMVERKKPGLHKARKAEQYSKR